MGRRKSSDWITGSELSKINKELKSERRRTCISCGDLQETISQLRKHERTVCKVEVKPKTALPGKVKKAREALSKKEASKNQVNEDSNEVDVTPEEFLQSLDKVRTFALTNGVTEDILKALSDLETQQGVSKKSNNSSNQTQITKFLKQ